MNAKSSTNKSHGGKNMSDISAQPVVHWKDIRGRTYDRGRLELSNKEER